MNLKGALPTLILETLSQGPNHGYRIAQHIKMRSKGVLDFKEGTLYPALHALEAKGYLTSAERTENGRTRRYYELTHDGRKQLADEREEWKRLSGAVNAVLEGGR